MMFTPIFFPLMGQLVFQMSMEMNPFLAFMVAHSLPVVREPNRP